MAIEIIMPQIGQDIETGRIVEWLKNEQDPVEQGEIICTVEADKGIFEVEAEASGILLKIICRAGEDAKVLKPIGYIGKAGETIES